MYVPLLHCYSRTKQPAPSYQGLGLLAGPDTARGITAAPTTRGPATARRRADDTTPSQATAAFVTAGLRAPADDRP